jgi:hypothetical protein
MKARIAAALAAAAALGATAPAAHGASIAAQGSCFVSSRPVPIAGAGFTPGAFASLSGDAFGGAQADAAGNLVTAVTAPPATTIAPRTVTVTASDGANAANTAATRFPVVRDLFITNAPVSGRPRQRTTWRFAGFQPGRPIYGHFRFDGVTRRNFRFGRATGPCGTLVRRAPRVPVGTLRSGAWILQVDQRRTYRRTAPRRVLRFRLFRTLQ